MHPYAGGTHDQHDAHLPARGDRRLRRRRLLAGQPISHLVLLLDHPSGEVWLPEIPDHAGTPIASDGDGVVVNIALDTRVVFTDDWHAFVEDTASLRRRITKANGDDEEQDELIEDFDAIVEAHFD